MTNDLSPDTLGSLPPEPVKERESVSTVTPDAYPDPSNGKNAAGDPDKERDMGTLNDGHLSKSELKNAGLGDDAGPSGKREETGK